MAWPTKTEPLQPYTPEWFLWMRNVGPWSYRSDCNGLVLAVQQAADPRRGVLDCISSIGMDRIELAVWLAKRTMRKARVHGLLHEYERFACVRCGGHVSGRALRDDGLCGYCWEEK